jgi:hypothetical protein
VVQIANSNGIATGAILKALIETPGQSRYSLAAQLLASPAELDVKLVELVDEGLLIRGTVEGDEEPIYWASKDVVGEIAVDEPARAESR